MNNIVSLAVVHSMDRQKKGVIFLVVTRSHLPQKGKRRAPGVRKAAKLISAAPEQALCGCIPPAQFALLDEGITGSDTGVPLDIDQVVPISRLLYQGLNDLLTSLPTDETQFSVLTLHIAQLSTPSLLARGGESGFMLRQRFHASGSLLEQVMVNVRRVLRVEDRLAITVEAGAAIVFPGVDRQGIQRILERVFASVSLLQAGTLEPPLTQETSIVIGGGSFDRTRYAKRDVSSQTLPSLLSLYQQIGCAVHHLTLRPVLETQMEEGHAYATEPVEQKDEAALDPENPIENTGKRVAVPFMHLPAVLPEYLTHLIPCAIARELRCAPVGQERHCLTVALLDPQDQQLMQRLAQVTGYTIFPVQCQEDMLNTLLTTGW